MLQSRGLTQAIPAAKPRATRKRPAKAGSACLEPDRKAALALALELMAIPGASGHEAGVVDYIRRRLVAAGVPPTAIRVDHAQRRSPLGGETGNLICRLPGTMRGPRRLLMAHVDTVPLCVGSRPRLRGQIVESAHADTALGADDRAGVAVVLQAALQVVCQKVPHPPLTLFWPVQEEVGLLGARYVSLELLGRPRLAFNFDGGAADKVTLGATGAYRLQVDVRGIASHAGAAPECGVSAVAIAGLAIARLQQGGWLGNVQKDGRRGTCNLGFIQGGGATNVVPDRVELRGECRSHDRRFRKEILVAVEAAFRTAASEVRNKAGEAGQVVFQSWPAYESFVLNPREPSVVAAMAAVKAVGRQPQLAVSNGGLDANWLTARGLPTVTLGCGQRNAHMLGEQLDVAEFEAACRIALCLAAGAT